MSDTPAGRFDTLRRSASAPGILLGAFALATTLILNLSDRLTAPAIAARMAEDLNASLVQVLPAEIHDNDPGAGFRILADATEGNVPVYIATRNRAVTGVAFELTGYGYGGAIRVLIGVAPSGTILGARVLSHAETPGLGDKIERAKDDWIDSFAGRSLGNPTASGWQVARDGGVFDQFSGATITPRAVVLTVHRGLTFFERHRAELLEEAEG